MALSITRVSDTKDRLGESPVWDQANARLLWVDSLGGVLHRLDLTTGTREDFSVPAPIGSFALRGKDDAILAVKDDFLHFDFESGVSRSLGSVNVAHPDVRLNDGKVDRQGRFLAGTMHLNRQPDEVPAGGLYRLDLDHKITLLAEDIATSNGPCFSPDGRKLYFADSSRHVIWAFDYDIDTGTPYNKRIFVDLNPLGTAPDGATVDAEGNLWSALVRSGQIGCFDPSGRLVRRINMPVTHPTSVAFGGPDLDILFVTSISKSMRMTATEEEAGWLLAIEGLGVTGIAEPRFAG
ncbi:SMP-30/gluconolactonase/LRE family protein [Acetobacteraceae bacterium H6797]|nr:SMP-30/gluconolactonase/LRE family protein [Acetobacteraceae bacterium H6797]